MPSKVRKTAADCVKAIRDTAKEGVVINDDDAKDLLARIDRLAERRMQKTGMRKEDALKEIQGELIADDLTAAKVQERNALMALEKRNEIVSFAKQYVRDTGSTYGEALQAMLEGSAKLSDGNRFHTDQRMKQTFNRYFGELVVGLDDEGLFRDFKAGKHEDDVYVELAELTKSAENRTVGLSGNKKATKIAGLIHDVREKMRIRMNEAGAYILPLEGYITRQIHSPKRIRQLGEGDSPSARQKDSYKKWASTVAPLLDIDRTLSNGQDLDKMLREVHDNFYSGNHDVINPEAEMDLYSVKGGGSLAKKVSSHRKLHFKDAKSALEYQRQFGEKKYSSSIIDEMETASRNIAMMETFGPNSSDNFDKIKRELLQVAEKVADDETIPAKARDSERQVKSLRGGVAAKRLEGAWNTVSGENDRLQDASIARVSAGVKALKRMATLGGVVISALGDKAFMQVAGARQGMRQMDVLGNQIFGMANKSKDDKRRLRLMGAYLDSMMGNTAYRYDIHTKATGFIGKMEEFFFHANGMNWWNNTNKAIFTDLEASHLGVHADLSFGELPEELSNTLKSYGIKDAEWNAMRSVVEDVEGNAYIMPASVRNLSDSQVAEIVIADGKKPTSANISRKRNKLEDTIRVYMGDQADIAVPTPGAAEKKYITLNSEAGTIKGEAIRMAMMYKSFPITVWTKVLPNIAYSQGKANTVKEFLMGNDKKGLLLLAQMIALTTVGGYMSGAIKDRLRGRTRKKLVNEDGTFNQKVLVDAMVRGGGMGIYGDMLFGQYNRHYERFTGVMAGPIFGQVDQAATILAKAREGEDPSYNIMKLMKSNLPYGNLPFVQAALDYHVWYQMQEFLKPGSVSRMMNTLERENQQEIVGIPFIAEGNPSK
jgi:hypothetical protein